MKSGAGEDATLRLEDGDEPLRRTGRTHIERATGNVGSGASPAIMTGSALDFHLDAWAESSAAHGWPDGLILH